MATVDVTIYGAGAFGLAVGYACASRGAKVRVIDPNGVASGSSGGLVGALAPHVPENWNTKKAFQFDSLIMAEIFWPTLNGFPVKAADICGRGGFNPWRMIGLLLWRKPEPFPPPICGKERQNGRSYLLTSSGLGRRNPTRDWWCSIH